MNTLFALAAAMLMGLLFSRGAKKVRLPNVTAYLIAGLVIGPYCIGIFNGDNLSALEQITNVALGFIAFSIGNEFKLENIKRLGSKVLIITLFQAFLAAALVIVALLVFGFDTPLALTLGAIATATAPAATLMVVRQYRAKGRMTSMLLSVVALDDAIGLGMFAILLAVSRSLATDAMPTVMNMLVQPIAEIAFSLAIGFAIGCAMSFCFRFFRSRANKLSIVVACVLLGVALAEILHLSALLLCMSIGAAMVNLRNDADSIIEQTDRWTPPLFMLFFVISGAQLDLGVLSGVGLLGAIYILARSAGKYFGTYFGARLVKAEEKIQKYLGITLLPQAGVAIGMAQVVITELPMYGEQIRAVVLCATLIYELFGPVLTRIALMKAGEVPKEAMPKKKARKIPAQQEHT
ncbi:MAG: cation:proton antiporter [Christensenellales bacterium]|jgi:Kef-type K+ transport system membrane component KefB